MIPEKGIASTAKYFGNSVIISGTEDYISKSEFYHRTLANSAPTTRNTAINAFLWDLRNASE